MILTFVESEEGRVAGASLEALSVARRLAADAATSSEAVVYGSPAAELVAQIGAQGAGTVHVVVHGQLAAYAPAAWGHALAQLAAGLHPDVVLAGGTDRGTEILAHAAARSGRAFVANCTDITLGSPLLATRQRWGGSLLEEAEVHGEAPCVTVALHALPAEPSAEPTEPVVQPFTPTVSAADLRVRVVGNEPREAGVVSLTDARVVVGGGRGVGSAQGFAALDELAALLGGAVGVSRVVTSNGWRPHAEQVGQTGARIAPELYIACGISGAIQHMVGAKSAKRILAINTDADAPMVQQATYAVIGDLHAVIPALNDAIHRRKG